MTETEKGIHAEKLICNCLCHRGHRAELTPYHWPYDILVAGICKIEVKYSSVNEIDGFEFCLPEIPKSDITILICEGWKTLIVPTHKIDVQHLRISRSNKKYIAYEDKYQLISDHVHSMNVLSRLNVSDALKIVRSNYEK